MSYIEKKYNKKIQEIFENLPNLDKILLELLEQKSIKNVNKIAGLCAKFNKEINQILRKYYPEIKQLNDKLVIKSSLMFYYDLIDNLTDLIRNIENYRNINDQYYDTLIQFVNDKEELISGKYKDISTQELTTFYDQNSRRNLEKILLEKLEKSNREFFALGPLEEEIKKIALISGASSINITTMDTNVEYELKSANSMIKIAIHESQNNELLEKVGEEIKKLLISKGYEVLHKLGVIITNAKLLPSKYDY